MSKVSLYSLPDLKNTLDDHLPIYLTSPNLLPTSGPSLPKSLRYTQTHFHTYIRLVLGYTAVAIAGFLFYLDWYLKVPFSSHKRVAAPATIVYFALNTALQVWIWFVEKGIVFSGTRKDGATLTLRSRAPHKKYDPVYRLVVSTGSGGRSSMGGGKELELTAPFSRFFAADGNFVASAFESWVRESIPPLAGPKGTGEKSTVAKPSASPAQSQTLGMDGRAEDDDVVMVDSSLIEGVQASSRDVGASASKKRPKKNA